MNEFINKFCRHFIRWYGGSIIICMIWIAFVGENSKYSNWVLSTSILGGAGVVWWLHCADKKREFK